VTEEAFSSSTKMGMQEFAPSKAKQKPMKRLITALSLSLLLLLLSGEVQASKPNAVKQLQEKIERLLRLPELKVGFQGVLIRSLKDNSTLYSKNAENAFIPASNTKILTSAAALGLLGKDFSFTTYLKYGGTLREGTLKGELVLEGTGDPTFSLKDFQYLLRQLPQKGIKSVEGASISLQSAFEQESIGEGWSADDEPYAYQPPVSGFNLNGNTYDLYISPGEKQGDPVAVKTVPEIPENSIRVYATTGSREQITLIPDHNDKILTIEGTYPLNAKPRTTPFDTLAVPNLVAFWQYQFLHAMKEIGIPLLGYKNSGIPITKPLAEVKSPSLPTLLALMNKPSDNLVAECLFKAISHKLKGLGSWKESQKLTADYFKQIGLDPAQLSQRDGSGLSRQNLVSPNNIVRLLTLLSKSEDFPIFYASLPIAGVDGTLKYRMKGTLAENNCRAKTGSLSSVSSLSGYVTTAEGEQLVFSILMNNHLCPNSKARQLQDKIVALLAEWRRKPHTTPKQEDQP
jgi:D-alanyl-D-alanine carboxypeptidase/D-alanyl-D-alanine-endopeptidase (penicillin-binding protein 4)